MKLAFVVGYGGAMLPSLSKILSGESEVQGSSITWFSPEEVERWKEKLSNVSSAWEKLVGKR